MKTVLKVAVAFVVAVALLGVTSFAWAKGKSTDLLSRSVDVHRVDFPIPFPLDSGEMAAAGYSAEQADSAALAQAVERGAHLVESRFTCSVCHGQDFSGGVMVDAPILGVIHGPNLTLGQGSRTADFTASDWDRIVRHGVRSDGKPAAMPSEDFMRMSDRELSDIVAFIRSRPAVDHEAKPLKLGPLGTVLLATGQLPLSFDMIGEHNAAHVVEPPMPEVSAAFGEHLAGPCMGCHRSDLSGGKISGGDPAWGAAANLTPHAEGLGAWSYEDFTTAMREGRRPDGSTLVPPMSEMLAFTSRMDDTELAALWAYLQSIPGKATGK